MIFEGYPPENVSRNDTNKKKNNDNSIWAGYVLGSCTWFGTLPESSESLNVVAECTTSGLAALAGVAGSGEGDRTANPAVRSLQDKQRQRKRQQQSCCGAKRKPGEGRVREGPPLGRSSPVAGRVQPGVVQFPGMSFRTL